MFENEDYDDHERILCINDQQSGLRALVALHSTALGPAGGGCRAWNYPSSKEALSDVLRLSKGMSYKNAVAGLPMGGGKAVILGPVAADQRLRVFEAFAQVVNSLGGDYVTAEDVGVSVADMKLVASHSPYVSGVSEAGGAGGDPSPYTALGVRLGIEAAVMHVFGRKSIEGLRIAVQGLGGVGGNLARELSERGARLFVSDIDPAKVESVCDQYAAVPVVAEDILSQDVDVVAPCALGSTITEHVARTISARLIAGGANNQLANRKVGGILLQRGIAYAPDYVVNAGGIIMVSAEYFGTNDRQSVRSAIERIFERTFELLERADKTRRFSGDVADDIARETISSAKSNAAERRANQLASAEN